MIKAFAAFGKQTFIKPGNRVVINKPLFTSWAVMLAYSECPLETLKNNQAKLIERLSIKLEKDAEFFNAITSSTTSKKSIEKQFRCTYELLEEIKNANQS